MSNAFQSSFSSSSSSSRSYHPSPGPTFSVSSAASFSVPLHVQPAVATSSQGVWRPPANWSFQPPPPAPTKVIKKAKKRTAEEEEITKRTAARVAARLAQDHAAVLNPDTETPFSDTQDVLNRLLPYHVYHLPREDLDRKGKRKAEDDLRDEVADTRFALECARRKRRLEERFRRVRTRGGKRLAPDEQALVLAQDVLDTERAENASLNAQLRDVRAQAEQINRQKQINAARLQPPPPSNSVQQAQQYYRTYPYVYAHPQYAYGQPVASFNQQPPPAPPVNAAPNPANISIQVPASALPTLQALGIQPISAATLAPGSAPPPAVLRGSSADGMLNLDINVSLLQSATGLAMALNGLMARQ